MNNEENKKDIVVTNNLIDIKTDHLAPQNIVNEMSESFIEYAMSVIVSRALPDVRDGLKPVHRRIIYSMLESGFDWRRPHKKSARIVGEVLGKYHPHGDTAVYESIVRMAQDFSMRYPLIDGHGNFGSIDGDSAAAMRYTEVRLAKISEFLVSDIDKKTVQFVDNYDASEREPVVLPVRFPNFLVNGSIGIAVGMATNIPPHNLAEVIDAVIKYTDNHEINTRDLLEVLPGPDFPTGGIIGGNTGIINAYETGKGRIIVRSRRTIEELPNKKTRLIYTEIPYGIRKSALIEKIAQLVKSKQIEGITSLRDESNRKGIRIVIELKKDLVPEVIENQLFKLSPLQATISINLLGLVDGEPKTLNLKGVIANYLKFQVEITTKKTQFDLEKSLARINILSGLKTAIENIDKVIEIIRKSSSERDAQDKLNAAFNLNNHQSKAIVDMRLSRLTSLAQEKMEEEIGELTKFIEELRKILGDETVLIKKIIDELKEVREKFKDPRRTEIEKGNFEKITDEDLIPKKDIIVTLSKRGYVKRFLLEEYNLQKRGGVGTKTGSIYEDDELEKVIITNTHRDLLIFTSYGKVYRIRAHQIPPATKNSKGIPFINIINIEKQEKVIAIRTGHHYEDAKKYLLTATKRGIVKKTRLIEYMTINISGKKALNLAEGDELFDAIIVDENEEIIIGCSDGKVVRFSSMDINPTGRASRGVRGINLGDKKGNFVIGINSIKPKQFIFTIGALGFGKMTPIDEYRKTKRAAKGVKAMDVRKSGRLMTLRAVNGDEDVFVVTTEGLGIRLNLQDISQLSRNTKGVRIIKLKEKHKIISTAIFEQKQIEEQVREAISKTQEMSIQNLVTHEISTKKLNEKNYASDADFDDDFVFTDEDKDEDI